mmetsp:Transcript_15910/g.47865  ORF Transcript_15910/g.47865 Transcript_15910/m.47865 type:complete len:283 (+) Transcript_15910:207-1055(+)
MAPDRAPARATSGLLPLLLAGRGRATRVEDAAEEAFAPAALALLVAGGTGRSEVRVFDVGRKTFLSIAFAGGMYGGDPEGREVDEEAGSRCAAGRSPGLGCTGRAEGAAPEGGGALCVRLGLTSRGRFCGGGTVSEVRLPGGVWPLVRSELLELRSGALCTAGAGRFTGAKPTRPGVCGVADAAVALARPGTTRGVAPWRLESGAARAVPVPRMPGAEQPCMAMPPTSRNRFKAFQRRGSICREHDTEVAKPCMSTKEMRNLCRKMRLQRASSLQSMASSWQ